MRLTKNNLTVVVVLAVVAGVLLIKFLSSQPGPTANALDGRRMKGAMNAQVAIVEFTDFQCPACSKAFVVVESLLKKYGAKVSLEHKHFPLTMHANAMKASIFAECANSQGKFWPMHDVLFKSQTSWERMPDPSKYFTELAVGLGLDGAELSTCVAKGEAENRVAADQQEGSKMGVRATPTFLIDGEFYVGAENLRVEIERRLGN